MDSIPAPAGSEGVGQTASVDVSDSDSPSVTDSVAAQTTYSDVYETTAIASPSDEGNASQQVDGGEPTGTSEDNWLSETASASPSASDAFWPSGNMTSTTLGSPSSSMAHVYNTTVLTAVPTSMTKTTSTGVAATKTPAHLSGAGRVSGTGIALVVACFCAAGSGLLF